MKTTKKLLSLVLICTLLISAMLAFSGCDAKPAGTGKEVSFTVLVIDKEGNETKSEITTDKATVGEALLEEKLIDGEQGDYGLYIKTVNGILADYDVDGTYWGVYVNGESAVTGVDSIEVTEGATYTFKVETGF